MKNAHTSEFRANPERTPNELQTNSKTVPIQARFVVFSNGFCLSQLLQRAWIGAFHDDVPIQARCSSWDKQKLLEKVTKRAWIGTVLEFVWSSFRSSFGVRSEFARVRILHDFGPIFGEKYFNQCFCFMWRVSPFSLLK